MEKTVKRDTGARTGVTTARADEAGRQIRLLEGFHEAALRERDAARREVATLRATVAWLTESIQPVLDVRDAGHDADGCVRAVRLAQGRYHGTPEEAEKGGAR